jgi:hypothetical protein
MSPADELKKRHSSAVGTSSVDNEKLALSLIFLKF